MKNGMHLEKTTKYKDNAVYIFRIKKKEWQDLSTHPAES
jgi:hypothetical protein